MFVPVLLSAVFRVLRLVLLVLILLAVALLLVLRLLVPVLLVLTGLSALLLLALALLVLLILLVLLVLLRLTALITATVTAMTTASFSTATLRVCAYGLLSFRFIFFHVLLQLKKQGSCVFQNPFFKLLLVFVAKLRHCRKDVFYVLRLVRKGTPKGYGCEIRTVRFR